MQLDSLDREVGLATRKIACSPAKRNNTKRYFPCRPYFSPERGIGDNLTLQKQSYIITGELYIMATTEQIIERCQSLFEDLNFSSARQWKAQDPDRKVVGYMPIYIPRELIHAAGMLPLGILGGGDQIEVIQGDAYYQSYICRIPRSTIELFLTKRLDFVDGMLFPSICDVIRNLTGMLQLIRPDMYAHYYDMPQNYDDRIGGEFYINELQELRHDFEKLSGNEITDRALTKSIRLYNRNRELTMKLYRLRAEQPWKAPAPP